MQHLRVSTCCEYRHRLGYRLGGKRGQFILANVEGNKPCFRCQVEESLGIKRPHHPKPPEYSKYLQKFKKAIDKSNVRKKTADASSTEFSAAAVKSQKVDNIEVPPVTCSEQNHSDDDSTDHSEILENCFQNKDGNDSPAEEIFSENNDEDEIHEQLVEECTDDEVKGLLSEKEKAGDWQENELDEIHEEVNEDALEDHSKSLSYHPLGGSDGEDDVPCNETCMSFDYTADSDEEPVDETEEGTYKRSNTFSRQKSLCNSDDAGDQDSSSKVEKSELNKRRESADTLNSDVQNETDHWQNKLECPPSYSSSDEEEVMQQQVVTADIHINPSNSSTKNISQPNGKIHE